MPRAGLEPATPATEWPQTYALDTRLNNPGQITEEITIILAP
jgi:hypothetical protein